MLYVVFAIASYWRSYLAGLAGLAGIFQAGLDLVFFDELMKTVPIEHSAHFVSIAQSLQYLSSFVAPLIGTTLASLIGLIHRFTLEQRIQPLEEERTERVQQLALRATPFENRLAAGYWNCCSRFWLGCRSGLERPTELQLDVFA